MSQLTCFLSGGHSAAILTAHPEVESYLGLDVDPVAHDLGATCLEQLLTNMGRTPHLSFQRANYSQMLKAAEDCFNGKKADGILLDLGVSSMQVAPTPLFPLHSLLFEVQYIGAVPKRL